MSDALTTPEIIDLYRRRARRYDVTANLYYLLGVREQRYRERAVQSLRLRTGDTVVELGCGTGLNLRLLRDAVGPSGRVIGVDVTDSMLAQARRRVERHGWQNVELVEHDATSYEFPTDVAGVISTFAMGLMPDYDAIIQRAARALAPNGRMVVCDVKLPGGKLARLGPILEWLVRPFGATLGAAKRRPWEAMEHHLRNVEVSDLYLGFLYLAVGEAPSC